MRYGLWQLARARWGDGFPFGTLLANLLGSFALGVIFHAAEGRSLFGTDLRVILGVGVMGGFTTYSSFNLESLHMAAEGEYGRAATYVGVTLVSCFVGGVLGVAIGRLLRADA